MSNPEPGDQVVPIVSPSSRRRRVDSRATCEAKSLADTDDPAVTVVVPDKPPDLSGPAARALLRILLRADQSSATQTDTRRSSAFQDRSGGASIASP